jgi:hypothetical protein
MPNYLKHYEQLCSSRKLLHRTKKDDVYYEEHHIIPKSLGGSNKTDNLVLLTAREHFIAHLLLYNHYKTIGGESFRKMSFALVSMSSTNRNLKRDILNSRHYSLIKEAAQNSRLGHKVADTTNYKKPKSDTHKESIRKARLVAPPRSQATKDKLSEKLKGRVNTQNFIKSICPYCTHSGQYVAMKRWHFDNCKQNKKGMRYA